MRRILFLMSMVLIISLSACGSKEGDAPNNASQNTDEENATKKEELVYSNLADSKTREEIQEALIDAGVPSDRVQVFLENVQLFNETIEGKDLVKEGFSKISNLNPTYDQGFIQEKWMKKYPSFIGYNCRITSFDLMRDFIVVENPDTTHSELLFLDQEALQGSPKPLFTRREDEAFLSFFSYVPTEETKDLKIHYQKVKEEWKKRKIQFKENDKLSLISVFLHSAITPEEVHLFIGHVGVLVRMKDGELLFLEKLSFQEPYQAIRFSDHQALVHYLKSKYDDSADQPTAAPLILENDRWLEETSGGEQKESGGGEHRCPSV